MGFSRIASVGGYVSHAHQCDDDPGKLKLAGAKGCSMEKHMESPTRSGDVRPEETRRPSASPEKRGRPRVVVGDKARGLRNRRTKISHAEYRGEKRKEADDDKAFGEAQGNTLGTAVVDRAMQYCEEHLDIRG